MDTTISATNWHGNMTVKADDFGVFPGGEFAKHAQATIEWAADEMTVTWYSNISTGGRGTLMRSDAARVEPPVQRLLARRMKCCGCDLL
ncbi:hypothetical protein [Paraburkholderia guartelaensis]|uniref:Uncharacterized protein n=1 Tax=Paraburkholderia guartelaensis TaxID=2546446 RepID=A0ABU9SLX2_9BURK